MILQRLALLYSVQSFPASLTMAKVRDHIAVCLAFLIHSAVPEIIEGGIPRALISVPDLFSDTQGHKSKKGGKPGEEIGHCSVV